MLGWINLSVQAFITDTFGADKWEEVLTASQVPATWVSSCPYSDKVTYDIVVTAAGILGVSVNDALEAYGLYFIQYLSDQGYTKLLAVLGSNLAEFLQNLNNLHLHLSHHWPEMIAPAFRCEEVTPESLVLHYYSSRPGLWPIVRGVLRGMAGTYFKLQGELRVELLRSREAGDCDHEVFKLSYPYQAQLRGWGAASAQARASLFSLSPALFYELHPFHLIMDEGLTLLQWGPGVARVVPELAEGQHLRQHFKFKHPAHVQLDFAAIALHTNNHFVLQARASLVTLKGQMLPTEVTLPGASSPCRVLVFLGSPRVRGLGEMQASGVFLSDIPLHDISADYILLAEQRAAEADLKDKYERLTLELQAANDKLASTTAWLEEEKARAEALLYRMSGLIACFPCGPGENSPQALAAIADCQSQAAALVGTQPAASGGTATNSGSSGMGNRHSMALDRIEAVRRELARANISTAEENHIQCLELLGEGTYGKVYKGLWKGSVVAIKTIVLPEAMSGQEKREKMAIMEAAISSALSHPNIMQTYTYDIKPLKDNSSRGGPSEKQLLLMGSTADSTGGVSSGGAAAAGAGGMTAGENAGVHSYEVRLLCEYCDRGSLREALDLGAFNLPDGGLNYPAVLDTAVEIATAVAHLHTCNVLHSDLKARNIMLKSSGSEGRGATSKVADFGLAVKMDHMETHLSNAFQGTMTHMAPEIMIKGHISKAADVYALGMVLWELYTAKHVFRGIPRALLGHQITLLHRRPEWPADAPEDYAALTAECWDPNPANRPTLDVILTRLQAMRAALRCSTAPLAYYDIESHLTRKHSMSVKQQAALAAQQQARLAAAGGAGALRGGGGGGATGSRTGGPLTPGGLAAPGARSAGSGSAAPSGRPGTVSCSWEEELAAEGYTAADGAGSGDALYATEKSIYLEHSESTGGDWRGALRLGAVGEEEDGDEDGSAAWGDSTAAAGGAFGPHGVAGARGAAPPAAAAPRCPFGGRAGAGAAPNGAQPAPSSAAAGEAPRRAAARRTVRAPRRRMVMLAAN
ncbi:Gucy1b1 [Scenedesmus sp. PABB004]|nr:Gucy1b1 [Scenedesmus sp. PABB004]